MKRGRKQGGFIIGGVAVLALLGLGLGIGKSAGLSIFHNAAAPAIAETTVTESAATPEPSEPAVAASDADNAA